VLTVREVREVVSRAVQRDVALLSGLTPEDLRRPTPCAAWNLTALAEHIVWGMLMQAHALRCARFGDAPDFDHLPGVRDTTTTERIVASAALLDEELASIGDPSQLVRLPYGAVPTSMVLDIIAMEAGVHADDVGATLADSSSMSPMVIQATESVLRAYLPQTAAVSSAHPPTGTVVSLRGPGIQLSFARLDGLWVMAADSAPATSTLIAADDSSAVRFALGRTSEFDAGLITDGDPAAARDFKKWFPGP
jgi:uncharacterized protein (TIGR03086 family)